MATGPTATDLAMDPNSLYREDVFTDRKLGVIRMLTPVGPTGAPDGTRRVLYVGEAQLLTPAGALPLTFEIEAGSLGEAAERFAAGAQLAVERAVQELQELRREAASSLVIPDRMPPGLLRPGGGGPRGPGRIQLP
jgi:hypothetical protein